MRKVKRIFAAILLVVILAMLICPVIVRAEDQQSISLTYTEDSPGNPNEYEISIPSSLNLNYETDVTIGINEISDLDDSYAVHVDLDSSAFNGMTSYNICLYPEGSTSSSNFMAYRVNRLSDGVDLHMGGGSYATTDVTAAIFYGDSSQNVGGNLRFNLDAAESRPAGNGSTYTGNVTFNIYGGYE